MIHDPRCNGVDAWEEHCRRDPPQEKEAVVYREYILVPWPDSWTVYTPDGYHLNDGLTSERAARLFVDGEIDRREEAMTPPVIVCLCGSTRFYEAFQRANYEETMAGRIVLSVGHYPHAPHVHGETVGCTPEQKIALDQLHKRKIDLADEVLILNVGGYIGESTRSELEYAELNGKTIRFLEKPCA